MGQTINSSRNPQPSYLQQIKAAYIETFGPLFSDDSKKTDSKDDKRTKESPHDKAVKQTIRARYHNTTEMLPGSQGNASFYQDTVAFSQEALAMMG